MQCDIRIRSPTYPIATELVVAHGSDETILTLKTKIKDGLQNPALLESVQKLIYAGHVLEDNKTLEQHNIPNNATFHLVTPPNINPTNLPLQLTSERAHDDDTFTNSTTIPAGLHGTPAQDEVNSQDAFRDIPSEGTTSSTGVLDAATRTEVPAAPIPASVASPTLSEQFSASRTEDTRTSSINVQGLAASAHHFVEQQSDVQRTSLRYELCYLGGFPYLVKSTERRPRHARRSRPSTLPGASSTQHQSGVVGTSGVGNRPRPETTAVRQHHVDLPATAAIPVRTADGRRALILSPEGVRVMAAQGVNVETAATNRAVLGVSSTAIRHFMSSNMPHAWLALKLAFIVGMLSTNSTWTRFLILNIVAIVIFLWQSGIFGRAFLGRTNGLNNAPVIDGRAERPRADVPAQAAAAPRNEPGSDLSAVHAETVPSAGHVVAGTGSRNQNVASPGRTWFQSFANAFISSIMPGTSPRDTGLLRAPEDGIARANMEEQMPRRQETPVEQLNTDQVGNTRSAASDLQPGHSSSRTESDPVQSTESIPTRSEEGERVESEHVDGTTDMHENMMRDW